MQLPIEPASTPTAAQRPSLPCMRSRLSAYTTTTANTSATTTNTQRQPPPPRRPKAAPLLWMFTSLMKPGMSACSPVFKSMFSETQYLSAWSAISTRTTAIA